MRRRWLLTGGLAGALALGAVACSGDDDDATPPASVTATATSGPVATATATPTTEEAQRLAQSPRYFLYEVSAGDTLFSVANAFDAVNGTAGVTALVERIKRENNLKSDAIVPGQVLGIPLALPGTLAMLPENSMEEALGIPEVKLLLLQPSLDLRSGYLGRLVLHRVVLRTRAQTGGTGEPGYVMQYWLADRPLIKGGEVDPEARVSNVVFEVSAGSLLTKGEGVYEFMRDGVAYALRVYPQAGLTAEAIARELQTKLER